MNVKDIGCCGHTVCYVWPFSPQHETKLCKSVPFVSIIHPSLPHSHSPPILTLSASYTPLLHKKKYSYYCQRSESKRVSCEQERKLPGEATFQRHNVKKYHILSSCYLIPLLENHQYLYNQTSTRFSQTPLVAQKSISVRLSEVDYVL